MTQRRLFAKYPKKPKSVPMKKEKEDDEWTPDNVFWRWLSMTFVNFHLLLFLSYLVEIWLVVATKYNRIIND
ncbi:hypothetical protein CRE_19969 [Caenorhabditis remanei]|uniref:Uncharacterized protein n=1 Tax=Caenorhabditis remanei TaxID=31234 RepID=E3N8F7_CAERE|nr:hypothetical protein CRE_19969 [Caenorhabditis remanei]